MIKRTAQKFFNSSQKNNLKSATKKGSNLSRQQKIKQSQSKQRTNSCFVQMSNTKDPKKTNQSHKKYNSSIPLKQNNRLSDKKENLIPYSIQKPQRKRIYSSVIGGKTIKKSGIKKNTKIIESLNGTGKSCINQSTQNCSIIGKYLGKNNTLHSRQQQNPSRKQDNIKTDFQQVKCQDNALDNEDLKKRDKKIKIQQQEFKKMDEMTSKQVSALQSKCQTIELLKFTLKTKLAKDQFAQSHYFNTYMSSNKHSQNEYIKQLQSLKELQTNFYVDKITNLQAQIIKMSKQGQIVEEQCQKKLKQQNDKFLSQKNRAQDQYQLLKRENQALRKIIMKKPNKSDIKINWSLKPIRF